ncbi:uncharacterized protein LY89DRAFT_716609 [Mollisia scopiformis]|uniref:Uncharacterized protein n=1 Tax=Mollisia scopiformis TaxID=149040 RepID=A0A194XJ80_MOLSC|nr:uncharacterized protein LY89DRAFT_716609 [Mollisia scopiformis]KUJ20181.1 hypothetical protein LY89DRAFT_716609 [Mollisia scopiformis]
MKSVFKLMCLIAGPETLNQRHASRCACIRGLWFCSSSGAGAGAGRTLATNWPMFGEKSIVEIRKLEIKSIMRATSFQDKKPNQETSNSIEFNELLDRDNLAHGNLSSLASLLFPFWASLSTASTATPSSPGSARSARQRQTVGTVGIIMWYPGVAVPVSSSLSLSNLSNLRDPVRDQSVMLMTMTLQVLYRAANMSCDRL